MLKTITIADIPIESISKELQEYISTFEVWKGNDLVFGEPIIALDLAKESVYREFPAIEYQLNRLITKAKEVKADYVRLV